MKNELLATLEYIVTQKLEAFYESRKNIDLACEIAEKHRENIYAQNVLISLSKEREENNKDKIECARVQKETDRIAEKIHVVRFLIIFINQNNIIWSCLKMHCFLSLF